MYIINVKYLINFLFRVFVCRRICRRICRVFINGMQMCINIVFIFLIQVVAAWSTAVVFVGPENLAFNNIFVVIKSPSSQHIIAIRLENVADSANILIHRNVNR